MGNNQSQDQALEEKLQKQQEKYDKLKKSFDEMLQVQQEKYDKLQKSFDEQAELQSARFILLVRKIEQELNYRIEQELASRMDDLKREYDQKIDQMSKQQKVKIEETRITIYEEFRQKQLKEAEERRKFKEEYPIPKFLNRDAINVAITGPSGAGKSTVVNILRGIKFGQKGEAKTGVNECTQKPDCYTFAENHPLHKIVYLWDLPGAGTANFPQETYIQEMGIRWYDAVIVVGDTRVRDVDISLMQELKRTLVRFVYVRTKMDNQVEANEYRNIDPKQTFQEVRQNLQTKSNIQRPYLIGLKYVLKKGMEEWENADFVELSKVLQMMCFESAKENKKEQLPK